MLFVSPRDRPLFTPRRSSLPFTSQSSVFKFSVLIAAVSPGSTCWQSEVRKTTLLKESGALPAVPFPRAPSPQVSSSLFPAVCPAGPCDHQRGALDGPSCSLDKHGPGSCPVKAVLEGGRDSQKQNKQVRQKLPNKGGESEVKSYFSHFPNFL